MKTEPSPDNKIVNGLWISPDGGPLSNLERLCIHSFCAHGHDFRLWTYGDLPNVPEISRGGGGKVEVRDGNEILSKDKIFRYRGSFAGFSDCFRWELMRQKGGWYADMDIVCLRPFDFADEVVFVSAGMGLQCCLFKFPKEHYIAEAMAESCAHPERIEPWDIGKYRLRKIGRWFQFWRSAYQKQSWGEIGGPKGWTRAAQHFGVSQDAKPIWEADLLGTMGGQYFVNDDLHRIGILQPLMNHAHSIHLTNSGFIANKWDKDGVYHPNSPFEILKRRYLPELRE